jgi:glutamyl-tRNA reductase
MNKLKENIIYEPFTSLEEQEKAEALLMEEVEEFEKQLEDKEEVDEDLKEIIKENSILVENHVENILKSLR